MNQYETVIKEVQESQIPNSHKPNYFAEWLLALGYVTTHNDLDFQIAIDETVSVVDTTYIIINGKLFMDMRITKKRHPIGLRVDISEDILNRYMTIAHYYEKRSIY